MKLWKRLLCLCLAVAAFVGLQGVFAVRADAAEEEPDVKSEYVLTVNIDTGTRLYERHAGGGDYCYCGFLSRVLLCAMLFDEAKQGNVKMDKTVKLTKEILAATPKRKTNIFTDNDTVSLADLASAVLVANAQEACIAIAVALAGSTDAMVEKMNAKAKELGMVNTTLTNVHGYFDASDPGWTTLDDILLCVQYALKQDYFRDLCNPGKEPVTISVSGKKKSLYYSNLILSSSQGNTYYNKKAVGVAAASSDNASWYAACDFVEDNHMRLVTVVVSLTDMGTAWDDVNTMLAYSVQKYRTLTVAAEGDVVTEVPVTRGKTRDNVLAVTKEAFITTMPDTVTADDFSAKIVLDAESVQAPVEKGAVLGHVDYYYKGELQKTVALVAQTSVAANEIELFTDELEAFFRKPAVWAVLGGVVLVSILYLVASANAKKKKRREKKRLRVASSASPSRSSSRRSKKR